MLFKNIYIPLEIQIYILSKIKDTKGYKNARLVCKYWYRELKILKLFNNQKLTKYITLYIPSLSYLAILNALQERKYSSNLSTSTNFFFSDKVYLIDVLKASNISRFTNLQSPK